MALRILPVNWADTATLSVSPAAVTTLPVTNLQSNVRDRVWRSTSLAQQVITGHWSGGGYPCSAWGMWPGNMAGSTIRVQLYSDTAWSVQVYDSGTLDFFTYTGTVYGTFLWGATPWGVEVGDRTAKLAPKVVYFTQVVAASFKITITNGPGVDTSYFEARRFWLADYVDAPYNARYGAQPAWRSSSEHARTIGGSLRRRNGARWKELRFDTMFATEADRTKWSDLMYQLDPATELVLSLFPAAATRQERDFTVMGSLEVLNPLVFENVNYHTLQLAIVES